jgi:hypothetical protein
MHRVRQILFAALIGSIASIASIAPSTADAAPARPAAAKKARTPISAEHRKALAELYGGFKVGMTKDEVIAVFSKQLDERYDDKIKATTDITAQDRLRRDKKNEISRLQQSYMAFDNSKPSPWDVSIVENEFAHNTGEAMLERWENQGGKNQRRFFFFFEGKLWKMFVSLDVSILPEDKKNFATFRAVMEGKYGPGDVEPGRITWRTDDLEARAVDKLKSYDALALVVEDPRVRRQVDAIREAKAPPRHETSSVIKAVVDTDNSDHPNVKPSSATVDDVLRAQGSPPPPKAK